MIKYRYKKPKLLFVGINPHPGSFNRHVPFSNNKLFWYLLSEAGLIKENRDELRDDKTLARMYKEKFNAEYGLGFVNIIDRPTVDITGIEKHEELPGRKKISRIIKVEIAIASDFEPPPRRKISARKRAKNSEFIGGIRRESLGRASRVPHFGFSKTI